MSYQALARKWRPQTFSQLVGQEHVSQSLLHALQHDRLHHAYLFTGTRGVGKTTLARILAKAINCESPVDFNPCGQCAVCQEFDQGRFMDLIEVDAASRTKVEDTRDLLENVQYAPNQGRYKIYLIDEVHMLSGHSFNALLKTLEEPPLHVKFLFATTDPQKIPVTVLSRCLQFNLKRLLPDQIEGQLRLILNNEQIEFDDIALRLLARAADGSLRDALSLLDQAIVYGSSTVRHEDVAAMLGTVAQQPVEEILLALAGLDGKALMMKIDDVAHLSPDFGDILHQILRVLHRVALTQQIPDLMDHEFDQHFLHQIANRLSCEDVQLFYQIGLIGQKDLAFAPDPRSGFEMIMLRMLTFRPKTSATVKAAAPAEKKQPEQVSGDTPTKPPEHPLTTSKPVVDLPQYTESGDVGWSQIIQAMKLRGLTRELANHCVLETVDDEACHLIIDPTCQHLVRDKTRDNLQQALQEYFGKTLKLLISAQTTGNVTPAVEQQRIRDNQQQAAVEAIHSDENVQALKEQFGARVLSGTIEPNDE